MSRTLELRYEETRNRLEPNVRDFAPEHSRGPMRKPTVLLLACSKVVWVLLCADAVSAQTAYRSIEATRRTSAAVVETGLLHDGATIRSIEQAVDRQVRRVMLSSTSDHSRFQVRPVPRDRNWIKRHPVIFGALVGFGGGFVAGYLAGDDAVFEDFTKEFHGIAFGGIGALAGAILGELILTPPADSTP